MPSQIDEHERDRVFKLLLDSLFIQSNQNHLSINDDVAILLTSWFNNSSTNTHQKAIFNTNFNSSQKKRLWYIIHTIESNNIHAYSIQSSNYTLHVHKNNNILSILDLTTLKCSSCGHFTHLEHACFHLISLYIATSSNSPAPQPTTSSITSPTQFNSIFESVV